MSMKPTNARGFTLVEFLVASVVSLLVLLALIGSFVHGIRMARHTVKRLWAQHRARAALEVVANCARPAYAYELYAAYAPSPGAQVLTGNYVRFLLTTGATSSIYRSGSTLYYIPSEAVDNRASSADDTPLLAGLAPQAIFVGGYNQLKFMAQLRDDQNTNLTLMAVTTYLTLRNM